MKINDVMNDATSSICVFIKKFYDVFLHSFSRMTFEWRINTHE
jgi:hypothetical protein